MVEVLLKNGANLYAKDRAGWSAPIWATQADQIDVIRVFISYGMGINYQDDDGMSLLMHAAHTCQVAMVRWLVENGADIGLLDKRERTALGWAEQDKARWEWEAGQISSESIPSKEKYELERRDKEERQQKVRSAIANCHQVVEYLNSVVKRGSNVEEETPPVP